MADIRIKELTELTELTDNDYFVVDNSASGGETKKYRATRVTEMIDAVAEEIEEKITPSIDTALAVGSASGDIASFSDGSNLPMPKLEVAIEPQQDLHGYDAPWVGGSGKNKLKDDLYYDRTLNGVTFARQADGGIKITGTATQNFRFNYSNTVALKTGQYILSGGTTKVEVALQGFGYVTTNEKSITIESDATYEAWLYLYSGTAYNTTIYPMLRPSNTDSTFAPYSNICPISGWTACNVVRTGKNLWDRDNIRRGVYTNSDGTTQSAGASTNFSSQFIKIKPNTIYSITMFGESYENGSLFGVYYDEYKNGIKQTTNIQNLISNNSKTFTTPLNAHYIVFSGYRGVGTDIFTTANTVVCEGTPTTYEPYSGNTYTINFVDGSSPLTVYGGTLDVLNGVLTVDRVSVNLGDLTYTYEDTEIPKRFRTSLLSTPKLSGNTICSCYLGTTKGVGALNNGELCISGTQVYPFLRIRDDAITDATVFKNSVNGQTLVYELATPQTIQLTPTQVKSLLGQNNVWCDTGEIIDCEYKRDATAIINSLIARIEALENQ